jgi:hypothetical protein
MGGAYIIRMENMTNAYEMLARKPEAKRPLVDLD